MSIKVTVTPKTAKEEKYPYFGKHQNGHVVLFASKTSAISLTKSILYEIGEVSSFREDLFPRITGTITIEQD